MLDYPISVVIPTRVGWPAMRISVDAVLPQIREHGGQLIIADASGRPAPEWADQPWITWLHRPGAVSVDLRQAAYHQATAPLIAITEDHCAPAANWVGQVITEHKRLPEAAAIFGIVDNGSREHAIDWALYGVGYLPWAPPQPSRGEHSRACQPVLQVVGLRAFAAGGRDEAGVSLRRRATRGRAGGGRQ